MNDDELSTAVRKSVTNVHSATSVEQIMGRAARCAPGGGFPA